MHQEPDQISSILVVELHYSKKPTFDDATVLSRVQAFLPRSEFLMNTDGAFSIAHLEHLTEFKDGKKMPAQTFVSHAETEGHPEVPPEFLQQTFDWPDARNALSESYAQVLIAEFMSQTLEASVRVAIFNVVLRAMLETNPPLAVTSGHARKILDPKKLLGELKAGTSAGALHPHLNVRFYNISNNPGDMIMDTLGPATLGLPDLQCHFKGLPPGKMAAKLFNTAVYLFEKGPVIETGNTVEGIEPGQKWKCQFEQSLLAPKRNLIDINPGPPYAAGERRGP